MPRRCSNAWSYGNETQVRRRSCDAPIHWKSGDVVNTRCGLSEQRYTPCRSAQAEAMNCLRGSPLRADGPRRGVCCEPGVRHLSAPRGLPWSFFLGVLALSLPFWVIGARTPRMLAPGLPASATMAVCPAIAATILTGWHDGLVGVGSLFRSAFDYWKVRASWFSQPSSSPPCWRNLDGPHTSPIA